MKRTLRVVGLALLLSLLFGLAIGTLLRLRMERGVTYIGAAPARRLGLVALGSAGGPAPLDVGDPGPAVLHPGQHEEQVG